jgi:cytoskeleton protein RodZ
MYSVGETLQRARLEQELDVATVAARTKINAKYLESIEADDRGSLPSSFFYKSFVHQYARTLSLDTKQIDAEIDRVLSADAPLPLPGEENPTRKEIPRVRLSPKFQRSRIYASLGVLILMLAACSGIYGWWYRGHSGEIVRAATNVPAMENVQVTAVPVSLPSVQPAAEPRAPAAVPLKRVADPGSQVLLDLTAREETWLSVSCDGKPVFSGILAANQSKTVQSKEYAKMRVGNAAGIEVRLNGKLLAPLGHRGQVLVVVFTGDNFQIMAPAKESD